MKGMDERCIIGRDEVSMAGRLGLILILYFSAQGNGVLDFFFVQVAAL